MPLTPEQKRAYLVSKGLNPDEYDVESIGPAPSTGQTQVSTPTYSQQATVNNPFPAPPPAPVADPANATTPVTPPKATSLLGATAAHAAHGILPTMAALGTGALLAPLTGGMSMVPALAVGLGGAALGGAAAGALQDKVLPQGALDYLQQSQAEHPIGAMAGELAPNAAFFNPVKSVMSLPRAAKALLTKGALHAMPDADRALLQNLAVNVGGNVGIDAAHQALGDAPYSPMQSAQAAAQGLIFSEPTSVGRKVFGFHSTAPEVATPGVHIGPAQGQEVVTPPRFPVDNIVSAGGLPIESRTDTRSGRLSTVEQRSDAMAKYKSTPEPVDVNTFEGEGGRPAIEPKTQADVAEHEKYAQDLAEQKKAKAELDRQEASMLASENAARALELKQTLEYKQTAPKPTEVRPEPVTTPAGKELHKDYTGNIEHDNAEVLKETQRVAEAERIQKEYEDGIRRQGESGVKPVVENAEALKKKQMELAHRAGINTTVKTSAEIGNNLGQYDPKTRTATVTERSAADTLPHEAAGHGHILTLKNSTNPKDVQLYQDLVHSIDPSGKHPIEETEEKLAKGIGEEQFRRNLNEIKDPALRARFRRYMGDFKARIKYGMGNKDADTLMTHVNARYEADAPYGTRRAVLPQATEVKPTVSSTDNEPKNQSDSIFTTDTERLLKQERPLGLVASKSGTLPKASVEAKLRKSIAKDELAALKESGLDDYLKGKQHVNVAELKDWIEKNGPKVEVRTATNKQESKTEVSSLFDKQRKIIHSMDNLKVAHDYNEGQMVLKKEQNSHVTPELRKEAFELVKEYNRLKFKIDSAREERALPTNRTNWHTIAPKAESEMPGYVEIAVTKPQRTLVKQGEVSPYNNPRKQVADSDIKEQVKFRSSHNFPDNTIGWVRGYMDGDTFRIIEVQSDWAQKVRKQQELSEREAPNQLPETTAAVAKHNKSVSDPTLSYYEHLALKAAIKHAVEQGAKHIAVDDAQTAMLTEGHDRRGVSNQHVSETFVSKRNAELEMRAIQQDNPQNRYDVIPTDGGYVVRKMGEISQSAGMKLHYDQSLPNILRKLTGDTGRRVEFGEHKMAMDRTAQEMHDNGEVEDGEDTHQIPEEANMPRKDLIFKNPDGTPKTISTGRAYKLDSIRPRVEAEKPFRTFGSSLYQHESYVKGALPFLTSEVNKIASVHAGPEGEKVTSALHNMNAKKDLLEARIASTRIQAYSGLSKEEGLQLHQYRHEVDDTGSSNIPLNAKQTAANNAINQSEVALRNYQNAKGLQVKAGQTYRAGGIKPNGYEPNIISPDVMAEWSERPASALSRQYADEAAAHFVSKGKTAQEAAEMVKDYRAGLGANRTGLTSDVEFNALRKAEGLGLPWSLVDQNPEKAALRYSRRAAHDLAYFEHIQNDPEVREILNINDQFGNKPGSTGLQNLSSTPEVKKAMATVFGYNDTAINPVTASLGRALASSIMGVGTAARNMVSAPLQSLMYARVRDLPKVISSLGEMFRNIQEAKSVGAIKTSFAEFDSTKNIGAQGTTDTMVKLLENYSNMMRKFQGRDLSDKLEGAYFYTLGKKLAVDWFASAGEANSSRMLKKFGSLVEDLPGKMVGTTPVGHEDIQLIAKSMVDAARGTYNQTQLPSWALHGQLAPFFALSRWSLEKSNVFMRDVVQPAVKGQDFGPLLRYSIGGLLTGAAVEEMNKLLVGKKGQDAEIKEVLEAGGAENTVAKVIGLMQLGSYGGILTDAAKLGMTVAKGKDITYSNPASFPLYTWATDTVGRNLSQAMGALKDGEDKFDVIGKLVTSLLTQTVQTARYAQNHLQPEDSARKERFRDLRVFDDLVQDGSMGKSGTVTRPDDYADMDVKGFKKTDDLGEAAKMVPELLKAAFEKAGNDPYRLSAELRKLKSNNYETMPAPEHFPIAFSRYLTFLRNTQGEEKASEVMLDYFRRNAVNKVKGSMIPQISP